MELFMTLTASEEEAVLQTIATAPVCRATQLTKGGEFANVRLDDQQDTLLKLTRTGKLVSNR